jgi:hypothetical protein
MGEYSEERTTRAVGDLRAQGRLYEDERGSSGEEAAGEADKAPEERQGPHVRGIPSGMANTEDELVSDKFQVKVISLLPTSVDAIVKANRRGHDPRDPSCSGSRPATFQMRNAWRRQMRSKCSTACIMLTKRLADEGLLEGWETEVLKAHGDGAERSRRSRSPAELQVDGVARQDHGALPTGPHRLALQAESSRRWRSPSRKNPMPTMGTLCSSGASTGGRAARGHG